MEWLKEDSKETYMSSGKKFDKSFVPFLFKLANTLSMSEGLKEHLSSNEGWKKFEGKELKNRMKKTREERDLGRSDVESEITDPPQEDIEELKVEKKDTTNIKLKSQSVIIDSSKLDEETKEELGMLNRNKSVIHPNKPDKGQSPKAELKRYAFPLRKPKSPLSLDEPPESFWAAVKPKKYPQSAVIDKSPSDSSIGKEASP